MDKGFLGDRRKALEEEFFRQEDQKRLEALRTAKERKATADDLREVSGIEDQGVLEELAAFGINRETLVAVALAPLVSVAWADRRVEDKERGTILARAHEKGIERGSPSYELLAHWLAEPPPGELLEVWGRYVRALCQTMPADQVKDLRDEIIAFAREVGRAAGGTLNVGKITPQQRRVLDRIEAAFQAS